MPRLRKSRRAASAHNTSNLDDIVKLWILRLLVPLKGYKTFLVTNILDGCFSSDALAAAIGLQKWIDIDSENFDGRKIHGQLCYLHNLAEKQSANADIPAVLHTNIQRLAALAGLDTASCRILEFAVMLKDSPLLEEACDLLGEISTRQLYGVLADILGLAIEEVRGALAGKGCLVASGLLRIDDDSNYRLATKIDLLSSGFASQMCAHVDDPLHLLRDMIISCKPPELTLNDFDHIQPDLDVMQPYLKRALAEHQRGANIYIYGPAGTGKSQLARVLASVLGVELFEVAREDEDGDPITGNRRLSALRAGQLLLANRASILLFDEVEDVYGDGAMFMGKRSTAESSKGWMNNCLETNPVPTIWISNSLWGMDRAFARRFDVIIELPVPPRRQRQRILNRYCADLLPAATIQRILNSEVLAPAVAARTANVISRIQNDLPEGQVGTLFERLLNHTLTAQRYPEIKRHDPNQLPDWYNPALVNTDTNLSQLADGLQATKSGRLCLYGPPGTGKTAFGRWLSEQLQLPLLVKRASDLLDCFVGETEKRIARAFRSAETEGALLLIDEVDSFLQDRRQAQRSWEVTAVNELLTQMESFSGLFIASTNLMRGLDQASLRRFDLKTGVWLPAGRTGRTVIAGFMQRTGTCRPVC